MNVSEWKKTRRKEVVTGSGLAVVVRELSPFAVAKIGPMPKIEEIPDEEQYKISETILKAGIISPKLGEGADEIMLEDLSMEDINELVDAILGANKRAESSPLEEGSAPPTAPS